MGKLRILTSPPKIGWRGLAILVNILYALLILIGIFVIPVVTFGLTVTWILLGVLWVISNWIMLKSLRAFKKAVAIGEDVIYDGFDVLEDTTEQTLQILHDATTTGIELTTKGYDAGKQVAYWSFGILKQQIRNTAYDIWHIPTYLRLGKQTHQVFDIVVPEESQDDDQLEDLYQLVVRRWGVPSNYVDWLYNHNYHNDSVSSWFPTRHWFGETHWYKSH